MGRELFDYAFKEYCRRWAFKHPTPADFFRTMEDASAVDLDWFWRGWFYTTESVDISLDSIQWYKVDLENDPEPGDLLAYQKSEKPFENISKKRNKRRGIEFSIEKDEELKDFYTNYKPWETEDSISDHNGSPCLRKRSAKKKRKKRAIRDQKTITNYFSAIKVVW